MLHLVQSVPARVVLGAADSSFQSRHGASFSTSCSRSTAFNRRAIRFLEIFRRSTKFSEVQAVCQSLNDSPLVGIFLAGYAEVNLQTPAAGGRPGGRESCRAGIAPDAQKPHRRGSRPAACIERRSQQARERRITFLATTAAVTPFIGLFGTVWGIIGAFQGIAEAGSTSLGVVAPGIAEALVTTAAGLAAAIPAVYFYNLLTQRVKDLASDMDDFSLEFLNIVERNFT